MTKIQNFVARFRRDEDGASMVEYAVALLVVTAIGVTVMSTIGTEVAAITVDACQTIQGDATATC